jgi:hypothetical protein
MNLIMHKRVGRQRVMLNPSSHTKAIFLSDLKNESKRITMSSINVNNRIRYKRIMLNPSSHNKAIFLNDLKNESKRIIMSTTNHMKIIRKKSIIKNDDTYTKDNTTMGECTDKKITNGVLQSFAEPHHSCLVLDGKKARSSQYLLKKNVKHVTIVNNNPVTISFLKRFQKRNKDKIDVIDADLHDLVTTTRDRFDVIYMDTCGFFTTESDKDLKASIQLCFYRNLLKEGGVFAVTISSRTNGLTINAHENCKQWIIKQSGLKLVFTHKYGSMITMFYK